MTNINLGGSSFSQEEVLAAIAASNDPAVDLSSVTTRLDAVALRLAAIEQHLSNLPSSWTIS